MMVTQNVRGPEINLSKEIKYRRRQFVSDFYVAWRNFYFLLGFSSKAEETLFE